MRSLKTLTMVLALTVWAAAAFAAPKKIITLGPEGSVTVVDTERNTVERMTCLTLISEDGTARRVTLPGALRYESDGRIAWTSAQLGVVAEALIAEGRESELPSVLLIRSQFTDGPTPIQRGKIGDVLNPECGACLSGHDCGTIKNPKCCEHATDTSCVVCRVCPSKTQLDMDLP